MEEVDSVIQETRSVLERLKRQREKFEEHAEGLVEAEPKVPRLLTSTNRIWVNRDLKVDIKKVADVVSFLDKSERLKEKTFKAAMDYRFPQLPADTGFLLNALASHAMIQHDTQSFLEQMRMSNAPSSEIDWSELIREVQETRKELNPAELAVIASFCRDLTAQEIGERISKEKIEYDVIFTAQTFAQEARKKQRKNRKQKKA